MACMLFLMPLVLLTLLTSKTNFVSKLVMSVSCLSFKQLSEMKKAHDDLVASLKEEHRDEIAELDSKHSSAIDGKLLRCA